jgi:hypothetical protein
MLLTVELLVALPTKSICSFYYTTCSDLHISVSLIIHDAKMCFIGSTVSNDLLTVGIWTLQTDSKIYLSYEELIQATKVITAFGLICMEFSASYPT